MAALENSTVLVTGGTGFIGSHLVERLVSKGARVRCLVRRSSSPRYLPQSGVELVHGDLVSGVGLTDAVEGADVICHVAGVTKAHSSAAFYEGNEQATENLLRACAKSPSAPKRLVHVSTLAAVGPSRDGVPIPEDTAPQPLTHYGKSKLKAEQAVRSSALAGRAVIVRPPVVYGPRDTDVYQVFRAMNRGLMLRIGSAEGYFSIIYVKDLVEALLAASISESAAGRVYFVANPKPVSWSEFGATAAAILERKIRVIAMPASLAYLAGLGAELWSRLNGKPGILSREKIVEARCRYWTCDTSKATRELGYCAQTSLRDGMAETLAWYEEAGWLKH